MPFYPLQVHTEFSPVGTDIIGLTKGFPIGGISIDNPTLSWLSVNILPGGIYVPPLTLGWATPFSIPKDSIDVRFVASPFGSAPSSNIGEQISVTIYEASPDGSGSVSSSPGSPIYQTELNPIPTYRSLESNLTSITSKNTLHIAAPGMGLKHRIYYAKLTWDASISPVPEQTFRLEIQDTLTINILIPLSIHSATPSDVFDLPYGLPFSENGGIDLFYWSNIRGNIAYIRAVLLTLTATEKV